MGQEFGGGQGGQQSGQGQSGKGSGTRQGQGSGQAAKGARKSGRGGGLGGPGIGQGGGVGAQDPLPGKKVDELVQGKVDPNKKHLSRTFMGQPDLIPSRTGRYNVSSSQKRTMESRMDQDNVPAGYRKKVEKYVNSLGR